MRRSREVKLWNREWNSIHMTGLYSRVYLEHHVRQKLIKEAGYFFSVDLDDFKSVNDSMGHLAGDKVIREFSQLLKKYSEPQRLSGEWAATSLLCGTVH